MALKSDLNSLFTIAIIVMLFIIGSATLEFSLGTISEVMVDLGLDSADTEFAELLLAFGLVIALTVLTFVVVLIIGKQRKKKYRVREYKDEENTYF